MFETVDPVRCWYCDVVCSRRFRHVDYPMIDVGVAFMFFWAGFMFIGFVIVLSILQAILKQYVKINDDDKENDDE